MQPIVHCVLSYGRVSAPVSYVYVAKRCPQDKSEVRAKSVQAKIIAKPYKMYTKATLK